MNITPFNVNDADGRQPVLLRWLRECRPDVACLGERRTSHEKFSAQTIADTGGDAAHPPESGAEHQRRVA